MVKLSVSKLRTLISPVPNAEDNVNEGAEKPGRIVTSPTELTVTASNWVGGTNTCGSTKNAF